MEIAVLQAGNTVRLRAFGGKLIERKVVGVQDGVVLVTSERELRRASEEHREPESLGWAPEDVLEVVHA